MRYTKLLIMERYWMYHLTGSSTEFTSVLQGGILVYALLSTGSGHSMYKEAVQQLTQFNLQINLYVVSSKFNYGS